MRNPRDPICGTVALDGTIRGAGSGGWSVRKTGTGTYIVTFNPTLDRAPSSIILTAIQSANNVWVYLSTFPGVYQFAVTAVRSNDLVAVDQSFCFAAFR